MPVPSPAPTDAPTELPTYFASKPPTEKPTKLPTMAPSDPPSPAPVASGAPATTTRAPTAAPVSSCSGGGGATTYHVYNATADRAIRRLSNRTATCLVHPYNVEVRPPCGSAAGSGAVRVRLVDASREGGAAVVHTGPARRSPPFFLFGPPDEDPTDRVPSSPRQLPNGRYYLSTARWGRLRFTQRCP